jgi:radical SAM protein with 4Fe4S-binding SPASM domain
MLNILLTERCNNNCVHCSINLPADDEQARNKELSTDEIIGILRAAVDLNYLNVRFSGGEPLLREDFAEIYIAARRMGLKVVLFTNATLITPALADLFTRVPPGDPIEISVYGMSRQSYEGVARTRGSHDAAWRGIALLLDRQVPFVVRGAVLPSNRHEVDELRSWSATIPWMTMPMPFTMYYGLRDRRDDEEKNALIRRLRLRFDEGFAIAVTDEMKYLTEMRRFAAKFMRPKGESLFTCGYGGCVDAYGYLHPCSDVSNPLSAYDLRRGSLEEAILSYLPGFRSVKATNPEYLRRCARCFLGSLCAQCPTRAWAESGSFDVPVEYFCDLAHAEAVYVGLLEEAEKAWEVEDWQMRLNDFSGTATKPMTA